MTLCRRGAVRFAAACWCLCTLACAEANIDPSHVTQRDSAGVQIVEAYRPAWDDASRWAIDTEPLLDLTRSGAGEEHEFYRVSAVRRLSDGRVAVSGGQDLRLYSAAGEFLGAFGREGEGPGEFRRIWGLERIAGDTLLMLDYDDRVTVVAPDLTLGPHLHPAVVHRCDLRSRRGYAPGGTRLRKHDDVRGLRRVAP